MPYRPEWFPAPSDPSLPVLPEPPAECVPGLGLGGPEDVRTPDHRRNFYKCRHCKGWVEGHPNEFRVDSMGPLSGRRGVEFYCLRCGEEVGFSGMMA